MIEFNGNGESVIGASCSGTSCMLEPDSLDQMSGVLRGLRDGWVLRVGLYRGGFLTEIPLTHVRWALDEMAARGCETK